MALGIGALDDAIVSVLPGMFGAFLGTQERKRAQQNVGPWANQATSMPNPFEAVSKARGHSNMQFGPGSFNQDTIDFFQQAGIGGQDQGGVYHLPSQPGQQDLASAMFQGAANRFKTEQELEADQRAAIGGFQSAARLGESEIDQSLMDTANLQTAGNKAMQGFYQNAQGALALGKEDTKALLATSVAEIHNQMAEYSQFAADSIRSVYDLRADALAQHEDQSARIMNSISTGIQQKLSAQKAEIEGRNDIPPAAKAGMKQRLEFLNGTELNNAAAGIAASEAVRADEIMKSQNAMVGTTIGTVSYALGQVKAAGTQALTTAYGRASVAQENLAKAGAELGTAFSNQWTSWNSSMRTMQNTLTSGLAGFRMQNRGAEFDMWTNMTRAYADFSPVLGNLMSFALSMNEAEYNRSVNNYNVQASQFGLEQAQAMPFNMLWAQSFAQGMQNAQTTTGGGGTTGSQWGGYAQMAAGVVLAPATGGASLAVIPGGAAAAAGG